MFTRVLSFGLVVFVFTVAGVSFSYPSSKEEKENRAQFAAITRATSQNRDAVLAPGSPPLTASMLSKTIMLFEWSLEIKFSESQKTTIGQVMIEYWRHDNRAEIESTLEIVKVVDGLLRESEENRAQAKPVLRAEIMKSLRNDPNDEISRVVIEAYEAAHSTTTARPNEAGSGGLVTKPVTGSKGLSGIYVGTRNFSSSISSVQLDYVTFLPDGHVYWTLPAEGLLYFDDKIAKETHPDDWGTYNVVGREIHVSVAKNLQYVFLKEGEQLKLQPHSGSSAVRTYTALSTADGLKLQGTYRRSSSDAAISFWLDGRFQDGGFAGNFGTIAKPNGDTYEDDGRPGTGTYRLAQNTLELRYSDGRVKRFAFTALPEQLRSQPIRTFKINYESFELDR